MNNIHPAVQEALETIDAAIFTGDPEIIRERLTLLMERWIKALACLDEPDCDHDLASYEYVLRPAPQTKWIHSQVCVLCGDYREGIEFTRV